MNSRDSQPKLPTWLFIVFDLALLGTAAVIGFTSKKPLSSENMFLMVGCVIIGAVVGLVPLVVRFEAMKNETLDERQRALEALGRTVHSSAEQLSIAANGLHEIAELAQRNLRNAEHLPQKLQEKIAEFQAQLTVSADAEKEELERELLALRTTESERLETVSQRIAKSSAEWTKLESATHQHLTAANEALAKLSLGTANAIGKAQASAEQALAQARTEAARSLGETSGQSTHAIETAKAAALAEIDAKFAAAVAAALEQVTAKVSAATRSLEEKIARLEAATRAAPAVAESAPATLAAPAPIEPSAPVAAAAPVSEPAPEPAPAAPAAAATVAPEPAVEPAAPAPTKRPRKPRREETPAPTPAVESPAPVSEPVAEAPAPVAPPPVEAPAPGPAAPESPSAVVDQIIEIAPVAPLTAEPFVVATTVQEAPVSTPAAAEPAADEEAPAPVRKRAKKAPATEPEAVNEEPSLGLDLDSSTAASIAERVLSSDGATRLLVTAYIGIGNRLFIRGAGPGLSWEKGVPLQFVSIGKWRWETNDAAAPVQFKLLKNDELECAALGSQSLDPGHQQEVTATF